MSVSCLGKEADRERRCTWTAHSVVGLSGALAALLVRRVCAVAGGLLPPPGPRRLGTMTANHKLSEDDVRHMVEK
jgi:hypothetical protein